MSYVAQLLPDLHQARVLRAALALYVELVDLPEEDRDAGWALLAKLTQDMRRQR